MYTRIEEEVVLDYARPESVGYNVTISPKSRFYQMHGCQAGSESDHVDDPPAGTVWKSLQDSLENGWRGCVCLDNKAWAGSSRYSETTLHQLSPYIGKMKSSMARELVAKFTVVGDVVLDPFCGSGTIPLECIVAGRHVICTDTNPYGMLLTLGKLEAPHSVSEALDRAKRYLSHLDADSSSVDLRRTPDWVRSYFHSRTLQEIIALMSQLRNNREHFLMACLLGILHHQRPGFLSYPASHLVPYLRTRRFPVTTYPELYAYRDVASRLERKIKRVCRRLPDTKGEIRRTCYHKHAAALDLPDSSIDAVITSPPYMNALDYGRDNRLRLWFLGVNDYAEIDRQMPRNMHQLESLMNACLKNVHRVLKDGAPCVLVMGELQTKGRQTNTAQIAVDVANHTLGGFSCEGVLRDVLPDRRRARRGCSRTKYEWIVVLRKDGKCGQCAF
jgi:hypothetical protein